MQIPYGVIVVLSGLVLGVKGPLAAGVLLSLTGMGVLMCARSSLKAWKSGRPSTYYTLISAIATGYLTWVFGAHRDTSGTYMCIPVLHVTVKIVALSPSARCMLEATYSADPVSKSNAMADERARVVVSDGNCCRQAQEAQRVVVTARVCPDVSLKQRCTNTHCSGSLKAHVHVSSIIGREACSDINMWHDSVFRDSDRSQPFFYLHAPPDQPAMLVLVAGLKFKMQVVKAVVWGPLLLRPPFALFFLSATMTAFLLYNVWAGGNAPRTGEH